MKRPRDRPSAAANTRIIESPIAALCQTTYPHPALKSRADFTYQKSPKAGRPRAIGPSLWLGSRRGYYASPGRCMVKSLAVKLIGEFCTSKVERRSANAWRAGNANAISLNKHACSPCRPLSFSCTSSLPTHPSHIHSTPHPGHQQPMIPFKHLSLFFHSFFFGIFFFNSAWYSYYTRSCIYDFDVSSLSFAFLHIDLALHIRGHLRDTIYRSG